MYMKDSIFNSPECCSRPCECPVCLENKPLMRMNCDHYVCLQDIQRIIQSNPRRLQKCPICRALITNYGCNGTIVNVDINEDTHEEPQNIDSYDSVNPPLTINNDYYYARQDANSNDNSDDDSYDELYGGKRRTNKRRTNRKKRTNKRRTKRRINKKRINRKKRTNKKRK